jgi:hypothetical protein
MTYFASGLGVGLGLALSLAASMGGLYQAENRSRANCKGRAIPKSRLNVRRRRLEMTRRPRTKP